MAKTVKKAATGKAKTKSEIFRDIAEGTGLVRRQVSDVFDKLAAVMKKELTKGPKIFTIPGLIKIKVVTKPATKAREGINPRTGERMMYKAKPARKVVRARPLKALKDMVL